MECSQIYQESGRIEKSWADRAKNWQESNRKSVAEGRQVFQESDKVGQEQAGSEPGRHAKRKRWKIMHITDHNLTVSVRGTEA